MVLAVERERGWREGDGMRETESVVSQDGIRWKPAGLLPLPTEFPASVITSSPILSNSGHSVPFLSRFHHFLTSFLFLSFPLFFSSLFFSHSNPYLFPSLVPLVHLALFCRSFPPCALPFPLPLALSVAASSPSVARESQL